MKPNLTFIASLIFTMSVFRKNKRGPEIYYYSFRSYISYTSSYCSLLYGKNEPR